jgi:hypothetical protein
MPFTRPTSVDQLPRETVQAFLDDLAALSARHGVVIDSGSLVPRDDDVGGYLLATAGYLHSYAVGDREAEVVRANLLDAMAQQPPRTMTADIAGLTAHELIRRLHRP